MRRRERDVELIAGIILCEHLVIVFVGVPVAIDPRLALWTFPVHDRD